MARQRVDELAAEHPLLGHRIRLIEGDICEANLGLADGAGLEDEVSEIYHLAAVYDLTVARDVGMRINVEGTRNVLRYAEGCTRLERLQYVSTCYVSGRYPGRFTEQDLDKGQRFNNFYEETKFLAEVEVQALMKGGLPTSIYRPSIVVGDSQTGATQKYDGPYFLIRWLLRQPRIALMPVIGKTKTIRFNVVPRDFVIEALAHLSGLPGSHGSVYQLCDPDPLTIDGVLGTLAQATRRRMVRVPLPRWLAKASLDYVPGVYRLIQIPSSAVDYFVHPTHYDSTNTRRALEGTGIAAPNFSTYADRLVAFVRANPGITPNAMI
jgi:thioester reductase-like protein